MFHTRLTDVAGGVYEIPSSDDVSNARPEISKCDFQTFNRKKKSLWFLLRMVSNCSAICFQQRWRIEELFYSYIYGNFCTHTTMRSKFLDALFIRLSRHSLLLLNTWWRKAELCLNFPILEQSWTWTHKIKWSKQWNGEAWGRHSMWIRMKRDIRRNQVWLTSQRRFFFAHCDNAKPRK